MKKIKKKVKGGYDFSGFWKFYCVRGKEPEKVKLNLKRQTPLIAPPYNHLFQKKMKIFRRRQFNIILKNVSDGFFFISGTLSVISINFP